MENATDVAQLDEAREPPTGRRVDLASACSDDIYVPDNLTATTDRSGDLGALDVGMRSDRGDERVRVRSGMDVQLPQLGAAHERDSLGDALRRFWSHPFDLGKPP